MTTINIVVVLGLLGAVICAPTGDLAGPEFLEVFMRSREPRRSAYYITDNIIHNEVKTTEAPTTTQLPVTETTESTTWLEPEEREVVKVSVTTSIGRQLSKPEEPSLASTADEPTITAVQRSHFGVDESSGELSIKQEAPESRFTVERSQNGENTSFTVRQIHQGDSSSSFTIQTKIPDKVEERTSYSVDAKQEKADKEEETVIEQRTFSTESRSAPSKSPVKNWHYDYTPKQKEQQNWPPNGQYERNSRDYRQKNWEYQERVYGEPEKNYEIDESVSVMSNGRVHGAQGSTTNPNKNGYVVEGSNYRKYRVEEKTPDGFIVGEYGVVSHDDGSLRGVRYTADSNINPRLIYDALVKFLSLK